MTMRDIKHKYNTNQITKAEFIDAMFETHKTLFDYANELENNDISEINISDHGVIFTSRQAKIKVLCKTPDKRVAPIETLNFNNYEQEEASMLLGLIEPGFHIFDVGANIGWYSLSIANTIKDTVIYAFEPLPTTFASLQQNVALNNLKNISCYNLGFAEEDKNLEFYYDPEYCSRTSAANLAEKEVQKIICKLKTMDGFVVENKITKLDFIKCDVEGAELFVYKGGLETITKYLPIIFSEMLRKWSAKFNYHPNDIIKLFSAMHYKCYAISGDNLKEILQITDETIETNFVFLHKEKHKKQIQEKVVSD